MRGASWNGDWHSRVQYSAVAKAVVGYRVKIPFVGFRYQPETHASGTRKARFPRGAVLNGPSLADNFYELATVEVIWKSLEYSVFEKDLLEKCEGSPDRRRSQRFPIRRRCRYKTIRKNLRVQGTGMIVNMSSAGILLTTHGRLRCGMRVEVRLDWPAKLHNKISLTLLVVGKVVRCEDGECALTIKRYEFRTVPRQIRRNIFD
jgi:hypothetical protein